MEKENLCVAKLDYETAMELLKDALQVCYERNFVSVALLINAVMMCVEKIGTACEINGQKKIEGGAE